MLSEEELSAHPPLDARVQRNRELSGGPHGVEEIAGAERHVAQAGAEEVGPRVPAEVGRRLGDKAVRLKPVERLKRWRT